MTRKTALIIAGVGVAILAAFLGWRLVRPMNIFVVSESFERPIDTKDLPASLDALRAGDCAVCHREFYEEWKTSIHSQAWVDPYFQVDWKFDGAQQVCKNCHIPLDRQQEHQVLGFRDTEKWKPILADNPDFDPGLQHEGVTCAACHLKDGKILGPYGDAQAPHPVKKLADNNEICLRCHVVQGARWDTFYRFPPCGTAAEIEAGEGRWQGRSGEMTVRNVSELGCVQCHMPVVERPLVEGGRVRTGRRHQWRGGHDPAMVKQGLDVRLAEIGADAADRRAFVLTLTNVGAAHYLPTGTPDRHLTVQLRVLDREGHVLEEEDHTLKRTTLWRPFIVDLWDTRLPPRQPRTFRIEFPVAREPMPAAVEAVVLYHLVEESRRARIGYENTEPIAYEVFRTALRLEPAQPPGTHETK
ncbi:MAG: multiheme c-type cytochrome [Burkholderiales bacterium]